MYGKSKILEMMPKYLYTGRSGIGKRGCRRFFNVYLLIQSIFLHFNIVWELSRFHEITFKEDDF